MSKNKLKALVWKEDDWYIAKAIGLEVVSQGKTRKEATDNLKEAVDLFLENEKYLRGTKQQQNQKLSYSGFVFCL